MGQATSTPISSWSIERILLLLVLIPVVGLIVACLLGYWLYRICTRKHRASQVQTLVKKELDALEFNAAQREAARQADEQAHRQQQKQSELQDDLEKQAQQNLRAQHSNQLAMVPATSPYAMQQQMPCPVHSPQPATIQLVVSPSPSPQPACSGVPMCHGRQVSPLVGNPAPFYGGHHHHVVHQHHPLAHHVGRHHHHHQPLCIYR